MKTNKKNKIFTNCKNFDEMSHIIEKKNHENKTKSTNYNNS